MSTSQRIVNGLAIEALSAKVAAMKDEDESKKKEAPATLPEFLQTARETSNDQARSEEDRAYARRVLRAFGVASDEMTASALAKATEWAGHSPNAQIDRQLEAFRRSR